jgi:hypothetical protein
MPSEQIAEEHFEFVAWALENAEREPIRRRCAFYRVIADICGDPAKREKLLARVEDLERADQRCRELTLEFSRNHQP